MSNRTPKPIFFTSEARVFDAGANKSSGVGWGRRWVKVGVATSVVATSLFAPLAGGAYAKERAKPRNERMVRVKSECNRDIARHLREFDAAARSITNSPWLTDAHASALLESVAAAKAAAVSDRAEMNAATKLDGVRSECRAALAHRPRLRMILRIGRLVQSADRYDIAIAGFQNDLIDLGGRIDALETNGNDVTSMRAQLDAIAGDVDNAAPNGGLGDVIIQLLDADAANPAIEEYKAVFESAHETVLAIAESMVALDTLVNADVPADGGGSGGSGGDNI